MSGLRFDYLKVRISYNVQSQSDTLRGLDLVDQIKNIFAAYAPDSHNSAFDYQSEGFKNVFIEAWGKGANEIIKNDPELLLRHDLTVTRLDIRRELNHTPAYDSLETLLRDQQVRNVTRVNSRPRSKKKDRDAGGYGLRVGSHQAIRSVIIYQRGDETPAIELTMRNLAAYTFLSEYDTTRRMMTDHTSITNISQERLYELLLDGAYAQLVNHVGKIWGYDNIPFVMRNEAPSPQAANKLREWLAKSLSELSPEIRRSILTTQTDMFPGE